MKKCSQERMQYLDQQGKVVYTSKDGGTRKSFPALECLANLCSHIPNRGEQMMQYHGFGITIRHFSSSFGNDDFYRCLDYSWDEYIQS